MLAFIMAKWEEIWQSGGSAQLWSVPDRRIVTLAEEWKQSRQIRRVLDVGCGLGRHAHFLSSQGFEVFGSDHSRSAVEKCREWLSGDGLDGEFWCGDLHEIPYPDGYFDAIIAFNSIYHGTAESLEGVVNRFHDKLRPGGRCFATFPSRENRMYGKGESVEAHTYVSPGMFGGLFGDSGEQGVLHHFCSEEELKRLFRCFRIESLNQEELCLATSGPHGLGVRWLKIPKAFFWHLNAKRME